MSAMNVYNEMHPILCLFKSLVMFYEMFEMIILSGLQKNDNAPAYAAFDYYCQ